MIEKFLAWFHARKKLILNSIGLLLAFASFLNAYWGFLTPIKLTASFMMFGVACYLYILGYKAEKRSRESPLEEESADRNIYTNRGNYNEHIQGNYVQGDYVDIKVNYQNISHNLPQALAAIQEALKELQRLGYSLEQAQTKTSTDLALQAYSSEEIRKKLFTWRESLGDSITDKNEIEAAATIVKLAIDSSYNSFQEPILVVGGEYQKLYQLLKNKNWKEADRETEAIIAKILKRENLTSIEELPGHVLKKIDKLWVNSSNGKFGFSVQQKIWEEIISDFRKKFGRDRYYYRPYYFYDSFIYEIYGNRVGWYINGKWIYYSDVVYSLKAPPGHLPIRVLLSSSFDYSHRCELDESIFNVLMDRQY